MAEADKKQTSSPQNLSSSELDMYRTLSANLKILSKIKAKDKLYYVAEGEHKFYRMNKWGQGVSRLVLCWI